MEGQPLFNCYSRKAETEYTYDASGNILSKKVNGTPYVSYDYNSEGLVGRVTDNLAYNVTEYHYDLLGRLVSSNMRYGAFDRIVYSYDQSNNLTGMSAFPCFSYSGVDCTYSYEEKSGRLIKSELGEYTVHYTYDVLDRVTCEKAVHEDGTEYYTYYTYLTVGDNTTSFVSAVTYKTKAVGATAETVVGSVHYTYDRNGFISTVTERNALGTATKTESYTYDALGQLKTVTNGNNFTEYTYDTAGNILSKKVNGTTVGSYTYGNTQWKDLLTSYNGQTITYDAIGNPTTYIGGATLTWEMGRRLMQYLSDDTYVNYSYNANGQRISKIVFDVLTEYYYDDRGLLVLLSNADGYDLYFYPDADGSIGSFSYNNEQYYYVRNAQNDIIGITDSTGEFVAKYTYDEWGKILTITDGNGVDVSNNPSHIANLNPFRYRSYFYDAETGFYWLNTRYYDPEIGRFLNADGYLSTGQGVIGHNMFTYCENNALNYADSEGTSSYLAFLPFPFLPLPIPVLPPLITIVQNAPSEVCGTVMGHSSSGDLTKEQMHDNANIIYKRLSKKGWSLNAICAVLGNMQYESITINPGRQQNGGGPGYGLVQWDPASKYLNWADKNGYGENSLWGQIEFLDYSMQPGRGEYFKNKKHPNEYLPYREFISSTDSVAYLTEVFLWSYERPRVGELKQRVIYAQYWYEYFGG